jgi:tartrate dehydrogenase/decarboxylase/D-malate dehydrogenase
MVDNRGIHQIYPMKKSFNIALIAGDGIGKEVMPEGVRVVRAAAARFGIELNFREIGWASCDYHQRHGQMMPGDWKAQLQDMDGIYFGAVGWPASVPDHVLCGVRCSSFGANSTST